MSLPAPNLDDRSFRDLVDEAVRLIPRYCPEWTHVGPSDPGIALLELYASMLEAVLFRLNRLPEKNHLAFLSLLGVRRLPAQPARTLLVFEPAPGGTPAVPRGTRVSTSGADAVVFETVEALQVQPLRLVALVSAAGDAFSDHSEVLGGGAPEGLFLGCRMAERFLLLEDGRFAAVAAGIPLELRLIPAPGSPALVGRVAFEADDGKGWTELEITPGDDRHSVRVAGGGDLRRLRLRPVDAAASELRVASVELRLAAATAGGDGAAPEQGFVGDRRYLLPVVAGRPLAPFGEESRPGAALHLSHRFLPAFRDARLYVDVALVEDEEATEPTRATRASESNESTGSTASGPAVVAWEFWNGRRWHEVGRTSTGPASERGPWRFSDSTAGLTRPGTVSFDLPEALPELELAGVRAPWIRARLVTPPAGGSVPLLESIHLRVTSEFTPVASLFRWNETGVQPVVEDVEDIAPFAPANGALASYFGFDAAPAPGTFPLYFRIDDGDDIDAADDVVEDAGVARLEWEAWDGSGWLGLEVTDGTGSLTRSGPIVLRLPDHPPLPRHHLFGHDAHWVRARVKGGAWLEPPRLAGVWVNAVEAVEGETSVLDFDSLGEPATTLRIPGAPVLSIERVETVGGRDGSDGVIWHPVHDLLASGPDDLHCICDPTTGEIHFGDGVHGALPPAGSGRIRVTFRTGGGTRGNVRAGSLTVLRRSIPFVRRVSQPVAATGGGDPESIDEVRRRGAHSIRSRDRAVTTEDFEVLAREASREVARVRCLPGSDGDVRVIVVPRRPQPSGLPVPSRALLDRVAAHLDARRLLTVRVSVLPPRMIRLAVAIELSLLPCHGADRVAAEVRSHVENWLHPLTGGPRKAGWPFGRTVTSGELRSRIESVDGVDSVLELALLQGSREPSGPYVHVRLPDDGLPFLTGVEVRIP